MEAARAGHLGCVRLLVNAGANVHAVDVRVTSYTRILVSSAPLHT